MLALVAAMSAGAETNDVTSLLRNANFEAGLSGWEVTGQDIITLSGNENEGIPTIQSKGAFAMRQTIGGLENGIYLVQLNGFFDQYPLIGDCWNYGTTLSANGNSTPLMVNREDMLDKRYAQDRKNCYITEETEGTDAIVDIARLSAHTVRFFNHEPSIAMISYSNFGCDKVGSPAMVHEAVARLQQQYPDLLVDGEMQIKFAINDKLRDEKYPFSRLRDKFVNTLVFPNLSSANAGYQLLQAMSQEDTELIGPIQMGLNKPIHFTDNESSVRDIVNIVAVAVIDAVVEKKKLLVK